MRGLPDAPSWTHVADYRRNEELLAWIESNSSAPVETLNRKVQGWAVNWRIDASWVRQTVLLSVRAWAEQRDLWDHGWVSPLCTHPVVLPAHLQEFVYRRHWVWDPSVTPRVRAEEEARIEFEEKLRAHLDLVADEYQREGFRPAAIGRQPDHYVWLVRGQILREPPQITRADHPELVSDASIIRGAEWLAKNVGLPLQFQRS